MSRTIYPTRLDLQAFLISAGLLDVPPTDDQSMMDMTSALASAVAEWERGTGWVPFLSGSATTRVYDPPGPERGPVGLGLGVGVNNVGGGRKLFLNGGVRGSVVVTVGVDVNNVGTILTANMDYWLRPNNATTYDRPYTWIEFAYFQWGGPQSITVNAPFGFAATVPDDAWYAMLKMAAVEVVPLLEVAKFAGLRSWSDGDAKEQYNERPYGALLNTWTGDPKNPQQPGQIEKVMARYRRKVMA